MLIPNLYKIRYLRFALDLQDIKQSAHMVEICRHKINII